MDINPDGSIRVSLAPNIYAYDGGFRTYDTIQDVWLRNLLAANPGLNPTVAAQLVANTPKSKVSTPATPTDPSVAAALKDAAKNRGKVYQDPVAETPTPAQEAGEASSLAQFLTAIGLGVPGAIIGKKFLDRFKNFARTELLSVEPAPAELPEGTTEAKALPKGETKPLPKGADGLPPGAPDEPLRAPNAPIRMTTGQQTLPKGSTQTPDVPIRMSAGQAALPEGIPNIPTPLTAGQAALPEGIPNIPTRMTTGQAALPEATPVPIRMSAGQAALPAGIPNIPTPLTAGQAALPAGIPNIPTPLTTGQAALPEAAIVTPPPPQRPLLTEPFDPARYSAWFDRASDLERQQFWNNAQDYSLGSRTLNPARQSLLSRFLPRVFSMGSVLNALALPSIVLNAINNTSEAGDSGNTLTDIINALLPAALPNAQVVEPSAIPIDQPYLDPVTGLIMGGVQ